MAPVYDFEVFEIGSQPLSGDACGRSCGLIKFVPLF
jgi:hypothetical protein